TGLHERVGPLDRDAKAIREQLGEMLQGATFGGPANVVPAGALPRGSYGRGDPPAIGKRSGVDLQVLGGAGDGVDQGRHPAALEPARLSDHVSVTGDDVIGAEIDEEALIFREA